MHRTRTLPWNSELDLLSYWPEMREKEVRELTTFRYLPARSWCLEIDLAWIDEKESWVLADRQGLRSKVSFCDLHLLLQVPEELLVDREWIYVQRRIQSKLFCRDL